ncbi:uncharacterized protein PHALS_00247 [Plasmopara halstedii]|uniref:Uncharacterized protein n=1 Tax=Plasmopara halstedii TaxID=4781 RepID=A0A0P1A6L2_PLAHL|nr:uncharacterized protein PHALS_00247 [Plasmopara halstedii]CEG35922.1 hypothetical protein PHALS_00247 [Plasmopara halstedii]|eukprot:XP_024572291.1 hypothetical protein PHALS_00247 [Plasmopara halstedii]
MNIVQPNVQEISITTIDWQNAEPYTQSFVKRLEELVSSSENMIEDDKIATQKVLYSIHDSLKQKHLEKDLVNIYEWVKTQPMVAKIGGELGKIDAQERLINEIQKSKTPLTPQKLANSIHVSIEGPNPAFLQWLRYCQSYPVVARDQDGNSILIRDESLWQMVIDVVTPKVSVDSMVSLFYSVQEVPGLEKFADEMVSVARQHQNQVWLANDVSAGHVFEKIEKETTKTGISPLIQWLRYINMLEAKNNCIVKLEDLKYEEAGYIFDVEVKDSSHLNLNHGASFEQVKDVPDVKLIAERLQSEVFDIWIKLNKTPENLFDAKHLVAMDDFNTDNFKRLRKSFADYYADWLLRGKKD